MEWLLYPIKLWNLITAFAYIVVPLVLMVGWFIWSYIHPASAERFHAAFTQWAERKTGRKY